MTNQDHNIGKKNFHDDMIKVFKMTAKEVKYKPSRRLDLINKYGGYEAAIKMLPTDSNTFDFTLLWEAQRLDLSIEALITKEYYKHLFSQEIVDFCQKRLDEYNYAPKVLVEEVEEVIEPYRPGMENFLDTFFEDGPIAAKPAELSFEEKYSNVEDAISEQIGAEQWAALLDNEAVFTPANKDLMMKIDDLEDKTLTPESLINLEGYAASYPIYEVIISLCKRIKKVAGVETPVGEDGKPQWWHIVFAGTAEDKKSYKWILRKELQEAVQIKKEEV